MSVDMNDNPFRAPAPQPIHSTTPESQPTGAWWAMWCVLVVVTETVMAVLTLLADWWPQWFSKPLLPLCGLTVNVVVIISLVAIMSRRSRSVAHAVCIFGLSMCGWAWYILVIHTASNSGLSSPDVRIISGFLSVAAIGSVVAAAVSRAVAQRSRSREESNQ